VVELYSKIRRNIKIIDKTLRSLHTMAIEVCYKQQFFISLARIENTVNPKPKREMKQEIARPLNIQDLL